MSPERWKQVEKIFQSALDLEPAARAGFLASACAGDPGLQAEVESLLDHHDDAGDFMEHPAMAVSPLDSLSPIDDLDDSLVGRRLGPYLVEQEIGHGGMGRVYRASRDDGTFAQQVAIKVVKRSMATPAIVARFQRERQILAMVNHPNIARLLDGGTTEDGRPYFVMELIVGQPVTSYCSETRAGLVQRLELFRAVCAAVAHAHQNLIVHRDLKPFNILVTSSGQVKLLDFGIAKIVQSAFDDPEHTRHANESLLTPDYAAPEQVRNEAVTTSTDVYALGLILYELLTGTKAQQTPTSSLLEIERVVCETQPRRPSDVESVGVSYPPRKLRGDLDNIVFRAIQKEPLRRYHTVNQLDEDIERYLAGRPVHARPDSFFYRAGKFVRRNKLGVAAAVLLALTLVGGIAATAWQARIAREHFDSVRSIARSLLTEINPAIADVPGTTKARHLIVQRSLEYLDKLSRRSTRDVGLMKETAEAYEAVATIQGNRNKANIGDYAGAMTSFRKALEIRERIEQIASTPDNRRWISMISAEASRTYPETDEAVRLATRAVEVAEQLYREIPSRPNNIVLANANFGLGYIHLLREEPGKALPCFTKARDIGVATARPKNNLSVCDRYLAHCYLLLRDTPAAESVAKRGLELDEQRIKTDQSPRAQLDLSYDYERLGQVWQQMGKPKEALEMLRKAEKIREQVASSDPDDMRARTSLADVHESLGSVLSDLHKKEESLKYLDMAIQAHQSFVKAAPESAEDRYELARAYLTAGVSYRKFGLCQQANQAFSQARAIFTEQKKSLSLSELGDEPAACASALPARAKSQSPPA